MAGRWLSWWKRLARRSSGAAQAQKTATCGDRGHLCLTDNEAFCAGGWCIGESDRVAAHRLHRGSAHSVTAYVCRKAFLPEDDGRM